MNFKRIISLILCILMLASCALPLLSCKDEKCTEHVDANSDGKCDKCEESMTCTQHTDADSNGKCDICGTDMNVPEGKKRYTVKIQTVGGMALEGVTVNIHNSDGYSICTAPKQTGADGTVSFDLEPSANYSIELYDGVPKGYNVKAGDTKADRYPMLESGTTITLSSSPIKGDKLSSSYELGDIMHDFTISDVKGNSYNLSSLLEEKKAVVLNFWYIDCPWCVKEFPAINGAYKLYQDDVEVLAINDSDDYLNEIIQFPTTGTFADEDKNLIFPFFKIDKKAANLTCDKFANVGYPTTVIIDRYGAICMIEPGAIVGQSQWEQIFAHFTSDNYQQKLITSPDDIVVPVLPNIEWGGSEGIANNFNGSSDINIEYSPETSEKDAPYSWPFIPVTAGDSTPAIRPSNNNDNSFSILHATVQLKPGEAIIFDYFASSEYGKDNLYVLVDKKDICTLTGVNLGNINDPADWEQCCAYVDPRPVTSSNKDEVATYDLSFVYQKDTDTSEGDDTVYLKNLRIISVQDIPVETYIFRFAATDPSADGSSYNTYVDFILGDDGYYHVKNVDGSVGPLLLANFLGYSNFDSDATMSERITSAGEFIINGVDKYNYWMIYANASSNSAINGYTPITEELKDFLVAYCDTYRRAAGKDQSENLWLQLCIYYDAYGKDEHGNPAEHVQDPIKGLTTFSAFETELKDPTAGESVKYTVTYDRVIMPRGLLYKFVPTISGVYRVTSFSDQEVTGWIFGGSSYDWAESEEGDRELIIDSETEERFCPELHYVENGTTIRDLNNVSLVTYLEAGKEYYIDIAYYDLYATGSFEFEIKYVGEKFNAFVMASPGPITFLENASGGIGQLIAIGIDYDFKKDDDGIEYAYHVIERDKSGNVVTWGSKLYADFYYPTIPFPSQSLVQVAELGGFNLAISEIDADAIQFLAQIREYAKTETVAKWIKEGNKDAEKLWNEKNLDTIVKLVQSGKSTSEYSAEDVAIATEALAEGVYLLKTEWGKSNIGTDMWIEYDMDNAIRGNLSSDADKKKYQQDAIADIETTWTEIYQMDDVAKGKYHGEGEDLTPVIEKYITLIENDPSIPERQGCVAVTRELSEVLSQLYGKYAFEDVLHDFLKFCFYYDQLGTY